MRLLDRYVLTQWIRIFLLTAVGFPLISVLIEATDRVGRLIERNLSPADIAISYVFKLPESMAQMIPAACLFATVFTLGPLARNSELTAAKASGQSFHRLIVPLVLAAIFASGLSFAVSEISTRASARALEIQKEQRVRGLSTKYDFVYRGDGDWIYAIRILDTEQQRMTNAVFERAGRGPDYPTLSITADTVQWSDTLAGRWRLLHGSSHFMSDSGVIATFQFRRMRLAALTQRPRELLLEAKDPSEMAYRELGRYVDDMRRSGNDVRKLQVEQALKIAVPATCFVIALFG
ncbi:MAG TPA: LptF/LptG family permease, partial [Gemmatimonadales bacterium]|nr:LptF/LptG family permease [Gemmatimonadales bacterium]